MSFCQASPDPLPPQKVYKEYIQRIVFVERKINNSDSGGSVVKNLPAVQETQETHICPSGWEDPLEEGMSTHSSIFA